MKQSDIDWNYCRRGMLIPASALLLSITLLAASLWLKSETDLAFGAAESRLQSAEMLRNERDAKNAAVAEFGRTYAQLVRAGVVGSERRLERIELLRNSAQALQLPYVRYTISGQQSFVAPYLPVGQAVPVLASTLELQLGLVHELDLLNLINSLRRGPGLFHVRSCNLQRVSENSMLSVTRPNITGECSVDWLTIPDGPVDNELLFADNGGEF